MEISILVGVGERGKLDVWGKVFCIQRMVNAWIVLAKVVVEANMMVAFKGILSIHMDLQGIEIYGV